MKLGREGFIAYESERDGFENRQHFPALSINPVDVSGAGDTVIAIASLCIYLSTSIPFLCNISNLAGKIVCQSSGVVPISKSKLYNEAKENELIKEA